MARAREAFAGVRSATPPSDEAQPDLTCCAYGRSCTLFRDDAAAALFNTDQHLQAWPCSESVTVDRYDVRLLLHDASTLGAAGKHTVGALDSAEEDEAEFERYRDLHPVPPTPSSPEKVTEPEPAKDAVYTFTNEDASNQSYSAVGFDYSNTPATPEEQPSSVPAPPVIPDVPFVAKFAVPEFVKGSLPTTERMHKIILQTAKYVRQSGGQTEFVLRVKQAKNANFEFLDPSSMQHPYFRWLVSTKPEEMIVVDAAPDAAEENTNPGIQNQSATNLPDSSTSALTPYGPHLEPTGAQAVTDQVAGHSQIQQQALEPYDTTAEQAQPASGAPAAADDMGAAAVPTAAAMQALAPRPALPIADMAALAQRIGSSAAASTSQPTRPSQAVTFQPQSAHLSQSQSLSAASGTTAIPTELQAIIQKLVAFIKKAGPRFEATVRLKEKANPKFAFLLPWNQYHWYYKQQLVSHLGQASADEVFALRATAPTTVTAPSASTQGPAAGSDTPKPSSVPVSTQDIVSPTAQETAENHLGMQDASAAGVAAGSPAELSPSNAAAEAASPAEASTSSQLEAVSHDAEAVAAAEAANGRAEAAAQVSVPAERKSVGKPAMASVPSNPRFAPRPVVEAKASQEPEVMPDKSAGGSSSAIAEPGEQAQEPHAAHAAPGSLEAVMEAQNALLNERQRQPHLAVSQEDLQTQRRKLVRQMLEAKQKATAETEEQKRQKQQAAIAKYRQAFASDTEEEVIHVVEEDDPEHEPLEPGEWVEEPEEKPAPAPVLAVAQRGALPSLEDLIKPRQDLVPRPRVFPLPRPASPNQQSDGRAEVAPASPSTSGQSHSPDRDSDSRHRRSSKRRRSRQRHSSSRSRSPSTSSGSSSDGRKQKKKRKHKRSKTSKRRFKEAIKEVFKKAKSKKDKKRHKYERARSHSSDSSEMSGRGHKRRRAEYPGGSPDDTAEAGSSSADALRAKVRAMLGR